MAMNKSEDEQHLDLLGIFHYVVGAIMGLFACFPIFHLIVGLAIMTGNFGPEGGMPGETRFMGLFFVVFAGTFILIGWGTAICVLLAGSRLKKRTNYTFCLVVAAVECMFMPFGTVLGVFTIVVLSRPSVKAMFTHEGGVALKGFNA